MKTQLLIPVAIALIVGGGAGFFGGMKYGQQQATQTAQQQGNQRGAGRGAGQRNGGRPVVGDILSSDTNSITVKMMDGTSKIIVISDSTKITDTVEKKKTDLAVGSHVGIFGTENTDGSLTAQNIQLNPLFRMGGQGGTNATGAAQPQQQN